MAGIDKTYVNSIELKEAIKWAKEVGVCTLDNGYKFEPINFIYGYNNIDDPDFDWDDPNDYILWNTPTWYDRWLWNNCPLEFVKNRLKEQYNEATLNEWSSKKLVWNDPKNNFDFGNQHYTFLKTPKFRYCKWLMSHGRRDNPWPNKCNQLTYIIEINAPREKGYDWHNDLKYDEITDNWLPECGDWPHYCEYYDYIWQIYHKNIPTKKSIIRALRKWYIPKGYIVKISNIKYKGFDFEILVK